MINGKVYSLGDRVMDALTLQEVQADRIGLPDDGGNFYCK